MRRELALSFGAQLQALEQFLKANGGRLAPEVGFAAYVFSTVRQGRHCLGKLESLACEPKRLSEAPVLAATGYLRSIRVIGPNLPRADDWRAALKKLSQRDPFPADRSAFTYRPLEVLGICLGQASDEQPDAGLSAWLRSIVAQLLAQGPCEAWAQWLYRLAEQTLGIAGEIQVKSELENFTLAEVAILRWISILWKELLPSALVRDGFAALDHELLARCLMNPVEPRDTAEAAIVWVALRAAATARLESAIAETWQLDRPERDTVALVENVCRRFPLFARQLNIRYENRLGFRIKDEYDVQDLLHALLLLHFDDVRPEEVTPSYAGNSSRMDFLLKSEKVVVEAKMTRKTLGQKEVANQLIEDKERYRKHPDCQTLVCFVYDPEGWCDNPAALEKDVAAVSGDRQVVVIVAPRGL